MNLPFYQALLSATALSMAPAVPNPFPRVAFLRPIVRALDMFSLAYVLGVTLAVLGIWAIGP